MISHIPYFAYSESICVYSTQSAESLLRKGVSLEPGTGQLVPTLPGTASDSSVLVLIL